MWGKGFGDDIVFSYAVICIPVLERGALSLSLYFVRKISI